VYVVIFPQPFHILVVNMQGSDDGHKLAPSVVINGHVVFMNNNAVEGVPKDGTEVAAEPEEVSVYAFNSYAHVMSNASHSGGRAQRPPTMVLLSTMRGTYSDDGLECSDPVLYRQSHLKPLRCRWLVTFTVRYVACKPRAAV